MSILQRFLLSSLATVIAIDIVFWYAEIDMSILLSVAWLFFLAVFLLVSYIDGTIQDHFLWRSNRPKNGLQKMKGKSHGKKAS